MTEKTTEREKKDQKNGLLHQRRTQLYPWVTLQAGETFLATYGDTIPLRCTTIGFFWAILERLSAYS